MYCNEPYLPRLRYSFIKHHFSTTLYSFSQFLEFVRKELQLGRYFWSAHVKLENQPLPDLSPLRLCLAPRIIPFQRPLKIKELLQKVTEAFGQQMDMFFMEKEVRTGILEAIKDAKKQLSASLLLWKTVTSCTFSCPLSCCCR